MGQLNPRPLRHRWQAHLRIEDLGLGGIAVAIHFTQEYGTEPMVAQTASAISTSTLRLQTTVLELLAPLVEALAGT